MRHRRTAYPRRPESREGGGVARRRAARRCRVPPGCYPARMPRPLPPPGTTHVLGVLNLTPDSFSDGGQFVSGDAGRERVDVDAAVAHAVRLVADGAALIDIGAVSTRPGSSSPPPDTEWARLQPVLGPLRAAVAVPLSLDTTRASILRRALEAGAVDLLNDVSAL